MKKTLVIGWRKGNVADELSLHLADRMTWLSSAETLDVTRPVSINGYLREAGPFDEIVYCAAVNELKWIPDITHDDLVHTYSVNVFGLVEVVAKHIELYGDWRLRIVALVSDAARTPMRGSLLYGSSKTALMGVIRNMARELAPHTTVVGVSPGIIDDTPMTRYIDETVPVFRGWDPEQAKNYEQSMIPLKRRTTKREVAQTLLFALNGPDALTGSIIEITGGK